MALEGLQRPAGATVTDADTRWHVFDDDAAVAREAAERIMRAARQAIGARGLFRLVLAGGRTPCRAYQLLVTASMDWSKWHIFYGDERCLSVDNAQRNSVMASSAWLDHVPVPAAQVHPIPAEKGAENAAREYAAVVRLALPFDLVLLGVGEDGHTASLFPGQEHSASELVHPVHNAPKPPPDRVSLSRAVLCNAQDVLILVTGASKREAVSRWRAGQVLPVAEIAGRHGVDVLIDRTAGMTPEGSESTGDVRKSL